MNFFTFLGFESMALFIYTFIIFSLTQKYDRPMDKRAFVKKYGGFWTLGISLVTGMISVIAKLLS